MKFHHFSINDSDFPPPCPSSVGVANNRWCISLQSKFSSDLWGFKNSSQPMPRSGKLASSLVETQSGGTRWNPSPEQIRILEALYRGGMRTPSAHQIERITAELSRYGRIEGKNIFYWFQNHKARERQKQKRSALLTLCANTSDMMLPSPALKVSETKGKEKECTMAGNKKRCRSWNPVGLDEDDKGTCDGTLELFPLHPEPKDTAT